MFESTATENLQRNNQHSKSWGNVDENGMEA
jgi:hypothetical protein